MYIHDIPYHTHLGRFINALKKRTSWSWFQAAASLTDPHRSSSWPNGNGKKNHGWNYSVWGFPGMEVPQNGIKWCFIRKKSETYMDDDLGGTPILGNHHLDVEKYEI